MSWSAPEKLSIIQLSLLCKMDRRTISEKLIAAGVEYEDGPKGSKIYVVAKALPALYSKTSRDLAEIEKETETEKLLLLRAKREKAELELKQKLRQVVPVAEVVEQVSHEYGIVRARFRAFPSKLAKILSIKVDPSDIFDILTSEVDEALSELKADADAKVAAAKMTEMQLDGVDGDEDEDLNEVESALEGGSKGEQPSDTTS